MERKMPKYLTIFKEVLAKEEFDYTGTEMAEWSGLTNAQISRFLNGKCDISAGKFFQLLESMPPRFKDCYWREFHNTENSDDDWNWDSLVEKASAKDLGQILKAVAARMDKNKLVAA
jgi:hypothetical protein